MNQLEQQKNEYVKVIDIEKINKSMNIRQVYSEQKMSELIESIKAVGLINPLTVRDGEEKDNYIIIAGHRRYEACKRLGFEKIPCTVIDRLIRNDLKIMIDENSVREDVSVIEEADFITKQIRKLDMKQNEFAELVGKSESWVADRVAVTKYPPELVSALKKGKISFSVAREFFKIDNHKVMREYLGYAITSGCTPRMAREWLKCYNQDKDYLPVNKLFDENGNVEKSVESEILTGCHICNEKFPLRSCVHVNVCPTCANRIWEGGRP